MVTNFNETELSIGEGIPKVIVPLVGRTDEELVEEAKYVKGLNPDVIEWRVDLYDQVEDLQAVKNMLFTLRRMFEKNKLLFTFRSHKEGGEKEISWDDYVKLNCMAIGTKCIDFCDVELFIDDQYKLPILDEANKENVFVVMSNHDFEKTPPKEELLQRLEQMKEYGANILKIAVMPRSVSDVITLMDVTNTFKTIHRDQILITMAMGKLGVITRLAGEVFGSSFTFAAGKGASAPGQIPAGELKTVLEILHRRMK